MFKVVGFIVIIGLALKGLLTLKAEYDDLKEEAKKSRTAQP